VPDLAQRRDLAPHSVVAGGVVEELERAFLLLNVVVNAVDLREATLAKYPEDFESAVDDVTGDVRGGLRPGRRPHLRGIRLGQNLAVPGPAAGGRPQLAIGTPAVLHGLVAVDGLLGPVTDAVTEIDDPAG